jgi:hypothetical protein
MKLFQCQHCAQPLYFENSQCPSCGQRLGYLPPRQIMATLRPDGDAWQPLAGAKGRYRLCANAQHDICNWLVPASSPHALCAACRHNRMIPNLSEPGNLEHWRKIEIAKHRLFYTLLRLRLPLTTTAEDADGGLAFDFLNSIDAPVITGHDNGLITINLAEADDAHREHQRGAMGEPYRTLLGHFRHEIAHYYWGRLIADSPSIDQFRAVFGDERQDYGAALQQHYANGAPANWQENFVTAYASSHPWEDFAETWAHYFHMVDTLETANAFGMRLKPRLAQSDQLNTNVDFDPHETDLERLIEAWLPLTFAANSLNRSMGQPDLYPFVLGPAVIVKLGFVHDRIHQNARANQPAGTLRAIAAGLRRRVGLPQ